MSKQSMTVENLAESLFLMDQLERLVLQQSWPVPFSPYYLVNHQDMLIIIDQLRASLEEARDERFTYAFTPQYQTNYQESYEQEHPKAMLA